jgi:hypothetical protein
MIELSEINNIIHYYYPLYFLITNLYPIHFEGIFPELNLSRMSAADKAHVYVV